MFAGMVAFHPYFASPKTIYHHLILFHLNVPQIFPLMYYLSPNISFWLDSLHSLLTGPSPTSFPNQPTLHNSDELRLKTQSKLKSFKGSSDFLF
jgi:hypothetical protein